MAPPVFQLPDIVTQLSTSWGGAEEGTRRTWGGSTAHADPVIYYSIQDAGPGDYSAEVNVEMAGVLPFTATQKAFIREAFALWDDLIAPSIVETANPSERITVSYSTTTKDDGTYTTPRVIPPDVYAAIYPGFDNLDFGINTERMWLDANAATWPQLQSANFGYGERGLRTIIHEIGHALGLSHPGSYDASDSTAPTWAANAEFSQDTGQWTIMSYFKPGADGTPVVRTVSSGRSDVNRDGANQSTPLLLDVAAIQSKYGPDMTTRTGNDTYGFNINLSGPYRGSFDFTVNVDPVIVIWDAGGIDRLDVSGFTQNQRIDLNAYSFSDVGGLTLNVAIAINTIIENATGGSGDDSITGNYEANDLDGLGGNDTLLGGSSPDTLDGGTGDDYLDGGGAAVGIQANATPPEFLTGGDGDDTFIYKAGHRNTVITDFDALPGENDTLDIGGTKVHSFAELLALTRAQGADTLIDFGDFDELTLQNFSPENLNPEAFEFEEDDPNSGQYRLEGVSVWAHPAGLSNGGFVVMTQEGGVIYGALHDFTGSPMGPRFVVNTAPVNPLNNPRSEPQAAGLSGGGFVVAWVTNDEDGHRSLRARTFAENGSPTGAEFVIDYALNTFVPAFHFNLDGISPTATGGFVVRWTNGEGVYDRERIGHTLEFSADGTPIGGASNIPYVLPYPTFAHTYPLASGGFVGLELVSSPTDDPLNPNYRLVANGSVDINHDVSVYPFDSFNATELSDGRILFTYPEGFQHITYNPAGYYSYSGGISGVGAIILNADLTGVTLHGTPEGETITGSGYDDRLYGLGGDDTLAGRLGPDLLDGGAGRDTADYTRSLQGVYVDLARPGPQIGGHAAGDNLVSIENLIGSAYGDFLDGDEGANVIRGGYGKDEIIGRGGDDLLSGEQGPDVLFGQDGDDTLEGGAGLDQLFGGPGTDTVQFGDTQGKPLYVELRGGFAVLDGVFADSLSSIENVIGGSGNDMLVGTDHDDNVFAGAGGTDLLFGLGGDDVLIGGTALPGEYNQLWGGEGSDAASYEGTASSVYASVEGSGGFVNQGAGYLLVDAYNSIESLIGGGAVDVLIGDGGANRIQGAGGADQLYGRAGADVFVFKSASESSLAAGYDTVADFTSGQDRLDLSALGIDASRVLIGSDATGTALYADTDLATPGYELAIAFIGPNAIQIGDVIF